MTKYFVDSVVYVAKYRPFGIARRRDAFGYS